MKRAVLLLALCVFGYVAARAAAGAFPDGPGGPRIAVINLSSLPNSTVKTDLPVFQAYEQQVCEAWHCNASLYFANYPSSPTDWTITLNDVSDTQGAIGYHTEINGQILAYVSVKTARDNALPWPVVFTHELAEMLVDPEAAGTVNTNCEQQYVNPMTVEWINCTFYAKELADPVQGRSYTLTVGKTSRKVSDFVYRSWFETDSSGPYDAARALGSPLAMYKNSYVSVYRDGKWQQQDTFGMKTRNWDRFVRGCC